MTDRVTNTDQARVEIEIKVPVERPLTLYLNAQEIVTMMTIGDSGISGGRLSAEPEHAEALHRAVGP